MTPSIMDFIMSLIFQVAVDSADHNSLTIRLVVGTVLFTHHRVKLLEEFVKLARFIQLNVFVMALFLRPGLPYF